jgi:GSCFA family
MSEATAAFTLRQNYNTIWRESGRGHNITVVGRQFIAPDSSVFALGSCFAVEIRKALRATGRKVYPDYSTLQFNPEIQSPGKLPEHDNINHYDTFVIRQEIDRAATKNFFVKSDFWQLKRHEFIHKKGWSTVFQDPYRRDIYAADLDSLLELSHGISRCIADGIDKADIIILTLGLTECWRNRSNGAYICMGPTDEDDEIFDRVDFHPSTFIENYSNVRAVIESIRSKYPQKKIVLTVSPVALARTWTDNDVVAANLYSKATLRAVAGQICCEYPEVVYWPSFEYAMAEDVFKEDGRHVRPDAVNQIVDAFLDTHKTV